MRKSGSVAERRKTIIRISYILLGTTALVLALSIVLLRSWYGPEPDRTAQKTTESTSISGSGSAAPKSGAQEESASAAASTSAEKTGKSATKKPLPPIVAIVIDDVGNNLAELQPFLSLPMPLTFAVMPGRTYTRDSVEQIRAAGKSYILHQPMEPVGDADPGEGAIYTGMNRQQIYSILEENLASLGGTTAGLNNHMGSKVTADTETMSIILEFLKERGMFFLDSLTTGDSVAESIAADISLPYMERNSMFLDNNSEREYVERALRSGFAIAEKSGRAVMIGHVWDHQLADLLLELFPEFNDAGFTFDDIGSMIYLGQQEQE